MNQNIIINKLKMSPENFNPSPESATEKEPKIRYAVHRNYDGSFNVIKEVKKIDLDDGEEYWGTEEDLPKENGDRYLKGFDSREEAEQYTKDRNRAEFAAIKEIDDEINELKDLVKKFSSLELFKKTLEVVPDPALSGEKFASRLFDLKHELQTFLEDWTGVGQEAVWAEESRKRKEDEEKK